MKISITPSHIIQYLYCPRFTYFEHLLKVPQFEGKRFKVTKGREVHAQRGEQNVAYLRKRLGVQKKLINQYLTNDVLRGEVDEILFLQEGTAAPLDYKFAKYEGRIYDTYRTQLHCYAWLIEANFDLQVSKSYLVYTRSRNKVIQIDIERGDLERIEEVVCQIGSLLQTQLIPKATRSKKRCLDCTYRNICPR